MQGFSSSMSVFGSNDFECFLTLVPNEYFMLAIINVCNITDRKNCGTVNVHNC